MTRRRMPRRTCWRDSPRPTRASGCSASRGRAAPPRRAMSRFGQPTAATSPASTTTTRCCRGASPRCCGPSTSATRSSAAARCCTPGPGGDRHARSDAVITLDDELYGDQAGTQVFTLTQRLREVGLFDETMPAWQDYDLWTRLIERYGPALRIAEPTYVMRVEPGTGTHQPARCRGRAALHREASCAHGPGAARQPAARAVHAGAATHGPGRRGRLSHPRHVAARAALLRHVECAGTARARGEVPSLALVGGAPVRRRWGHGRCRQFSAEDLAHDSSLLLQLDGKRDRSTSFAAEPPARSADGVSVSSNCTATATRSLVAGLRRG